MVKGETDIIDFVGDRKEFDSMLKTMGWLWKFLGAERPMLLKNRSSWNLYFLTTSYVLISFHAGKAMLTLVSVLGVFLPLHSPIALPDVWWLYRLDKPLSVLPKIRHGFVRRKKLSKVRERMASKWQTFIDLHSFCISSQTSSSEQEALVAPWFYCRVSSSKKFFFHPFGFSDLWSPIFSFWSRWYHPFFA